MFEEFEGTMPLASAQRFDWIALEDYLGAHVDGYQGPLTIEQFKGGQSNPTFKLITPERSYVLRAKPGLAAQLLPSAHAIEREYRIMQVLKDTSVPVPKMYCLCQDETILGRAFYVMEYVAGRVFWDQALPGASSAQRNSVYTEMNRVISTLHRVDYGALGLADFGRPGNYFARQIGRWTQQYRASETEPIEAMNHLIDWLPHHIPADDGANSIVHGDYRLDNLVFDPETLSIRAVLDWELSTIGHPLADFSYHLMSWHIPPGGFRGIGGLNLAALGIPSCDEYVALYCQATGRDGIHDLDFYLAYNMFRIAGILQGIMKRVMDGTAANAAALAAGQRTRPMAELGWSYAQRVNSR